MPFDATTYAVDPTTLTTPRERLEYLRDFLLRLPDERFDMERWAATDDGDLVERSGLLHDCGTAGCIGGWSMALFRQTPHLHNERTAGALLGLSSCQVSELFYGGPLAMNTITRDEAAAVLTHLLNTGEVDWSVARKAEA